MTGERKAEILLAVDRYNRDDSESIPVSPFIAREQGTLGRVAERLEGSVSIEELDEFLTLINKELPDDYLMG